MPSIRSRRPSIPSAPIKTISVKESPSNADAIAIFEVIYAITEKPMAFVRRFVPPLRLGGVALDLSFIVLLIAINLAQGVIIAFL